MILRVIALKKEKAQHLVSKVLGINSGNVLLSHNLEMHYHRGCSVSLPCSEWERVGPLRYDHQSPKPNDSTLAHQAAARRRPLEAANLFSKEPCRFSEIYIQEVFRFFFKGFVLF